MYSIDKAYIVTTKNSPNFNLTPTVGLQYVNTDGLTMMYDVYLDYYEQISTVK